MCGLFAIFGQDKSLNQYIDKYSIKKSFFDFKFRGPDNSNLIEYSNKHIKSYLGHHRLKVIDLSSESDQPLVDETLILLFNGEIFNFYELNFEFFKNEECKSDTKLLFKLIKKVGFNRTLELIKGQYAIVCYDKKKNEVFFSSDYFGQKPLYYFFESECLIISSNLTSINKVLKSKKLFPEAINSYQLLNYVPFSHTPFHKIKKLEKNTCMHFALKYKGFSFLTHKVEKRKKEYSNIRNIDDLENKLTEVVKLHLNSDVPVSALLSGGIDSSLLCLLISKVTKDIETFSISFKNEMFSEENEIKNFAKQIGLKNNIIYPDKSDFNDFYSMSADIYDEPFSDSSSINTYVISNVVGKKYKTCITGDGGDELFYGYNRYQFEYFIKNIKFIPNMIKYVYPLLKLFINNDTHLVKIKNYLNNKNEKDLYKYYTTLSPEIYKKSHFNILDAVCTIDNLNENNLRNYDFLLYLPYDILVKNDRASMYNSLELRSPFLYEDVLSLSNFYEEKDHINFWNKKILLKKILRNNKINYKNEKKGFKFDLFNFIKTNFTIDQLKKRYTLIKDIDECNNFDYPEDIRSDNSEVIWNRLILANWIEKNF